MHRRGPQGLAGHAPDLDLGKIAAEIGIRRRVVAQTQRAGRRIEGLAVTACVTTSSPSTYRRIVLPSKVPVYVCQAVMSATTYSTNFTPCPLSQTWNCTFLLAATGISMNASRLHRDRRRRWHHVAAALRADTEAVIAAVGLG